MLVASTSLSDWVVAPGPMGSVAFGRTSPYTKEGPVRIRSEVMVNGADDVSTRP